LEIEDIKTIVELMKENDLTHFELEREGQKLILKKQADAENLAAALANVRVAGPAPVPLAAPAAAAPATAPVAAAPAAAGGPQIKSPMVGTFYRSPGPGQDAFVKVGDVVSADSTVCIIEAMKVMNEIKAEISGRISRVLAEDTTPVQFGQPLFEIEP
jgi:acetyl-CoA carboxylase biotin carboxyl carrier protein